MNEVVDLVTAPFRDVVQKSKIALENAGDFEPMAQAAAALLKEGERALKRLEPLCQRHFDENGTHFVAALKENNELAKCRKKLNGLLWEFDDFIKLGDFDADKFVELQTLSREIAPIIYDILLTVKLDPFSQLGPRRIAEPSPPLTPFSASTMSFSSNILPVPVRSAGRLLRDSASSGWTTSSSLNGLRNATEDLGQIISKIDGVSSGSSGSAGSAGPSSHSSAKILRRSPQPPVEEDEEPAPPEPPAKDQRRPSQLSARLDKDPPRPLSANPWDTGQEIPPDDPQIQRAMTLLVRRPRIISPGERRRDPSSPVSPMSNVTLNDALPRPLTSGYDNRRAGFVLDEDDDHGMGQGHFRSFSGQVANVSLNSSNRMDWLQGLKPLPLPLPLPSISSTHSQGVLLKKQASCSQFPSTDALSIVTPPLPFAKKRSLSITESLVDPHPLPVCASSGLCHERHESSSDDLASGHQTGPEESEDMMKQIWHAGPAEADCRIDEDSPFWIHRGFCPGALEVLDGGIGIRKGKRTGTLASTLVVAKCKHCLYEFDFRQLELDVNRQEAGNFIKHSVGHRLRFLQKSHLQSRKVDEVLYGCIFCARQGHTLDPSDATVFTTTNALFRHLARHPRPLPQVPGMSIVEQAEIPADLRNNYDLWFFGLGPHKHPAHEAAAEIASLPSGVAKEFSRQVSRQRPPPHDRALVLEVMPGARITGITWPEQYHGEWCYGWHDGVHAAVPVEILKLNRPPWSELGRSGTASRIQGRARWRFAPRDNTNKEWLRFDKDEVIGNITWSHSEHWCWSGINAKGKWGIFPQCFIDMGSLQSCDPEFATVSSSSGDRASLFVGGSLRSASSMLKHVKRRARQRFTPGTTASSVSSRESEPRLRYSSAWRS